jgi:FtsH ternary system-associated peptide
MENLMAEMTIQLRIDPETGKKNIIISLSSDADALPHEHEQQHRALVEKLIEGGTLKAGELGKIVVERERKEGEPSAPAVREEPQRRVQTEGN